MSGGLWLVLLVLICTVGAKQNYGVVVDLGSKGSRVGVFIWSSDANTPYTEVVFGGGKNPWYQKITPGVAAYANNPSGAGVYLKPLLDYATQQVPSSDIATTPIFIKGTDNLRRLPLGVADAILSQISQYVSLNYRFLRPNGWIGLISGTEEGAYLWISANYLSKTFADSKTPIGTLDMGSGSVQNVFIPKSGTTVPSNFTFAFGYKSTTYVPYIASYGGYGYLASLYALNVTVESSLSGSFISNPCLLVGYSAPYTTSLGTKVTMQGTGSWAQCNALMTSFLNVGAYCSFPPCAFNGVYQPALNGKFMGVSNFQDVVEILDLGDTATPNEIISQGKQFCALSWQEAQSMYPDADPQDLYTYCFGANYVSTLLTNGFGFSLSTKIDFEKKIDKVPISWTLGAMVIELQKGW